MLETQGLDTTFGPKLLLDLRLKSQRRFVEVILNEAHFIITQFRH
jgi:hypothetical protein